MFKALSKRKGVSSLVTILLLGTRLASAATLAESTQEQAPGLTSSQQQLTALMSQYLVEAKNAAHDLAAMVNTPSETQLFTRSMELNLLYGTSFTTAGSSGSSWDKTVLSMITGTAGYNEQKFLSQVLDTSRLYKTLQANRDLLDAFNKRFNTYLPAAGSPKGEDREVLFRVTGTAGYNPGEFLYSLLAPGSSIPNIAPSAQAQQQAPQTPAPSVPSQPSTPTPAPQQPTSSNSSLFTRSMELNLLYGTSFTPAGSSGSSWDKSVLGMITGAAGYNEQKFLNQVLDTARLYKTLQANRDLLDAFNKRFNTYLPAAGSPRGEDREVLFRVTGTAGYNPGDFLYSLLAPGSAIPSIPPSSQTPSTPAPSTPTQPSTPTTPQQPAPIQPSTPNTSGKLFSPNSIWNTKLSANQALSPNSAALVQEMIANTKVASPWLNTTSYSTPYYVVDSNTPKVPVQIVQNGQVLTGTVLNGLVQLGVPIPANAAISGGTDGHLTIYDKSADKLYEFWQLRKVSGQWQASWGGVLNNVSTSNGVMPVVTNASGGKEYFGATATSIPVIAGTMLLSELASGVIPHALAVAIPNPKKDVFVSPALRTDGWATWANAIPEGTRFRFKPDIYINPAWSPLIKMMVIAIRDYGMVVRDKAGAVVFFGEDPRPYGGGDPYAAYYGGKPLWDVMGQFPWDQLQVVAP